MTLVFPMAATALLLLAALSDVTSYRIPNGLCLALAGLFALRAAVTPDAAAEMDHLLPAAAVLVIGTVFLMRGLIGGGDVKLLAAAALWVPPAELAPMLMTVGMVGGLLAVVLVAVRHLCDRRRVGSVVCSLAGGPAAGRRPALLDHGAPVPYGVAIAVGGIATLLPP